MIDSIGQSMLDFINPVFLLVFMLVSYMINKAVKSNKLFRWIKPRIRTFYRTLFIGLLLAGLFFWLEGEYTGHEVLRYLITMFLVMAFLWDGIRGWFEDIKGKYHTLKDVVKSFKKEDHE